jgi:predicted GNAT family N-acyltransferase
LPAHLRFRSHLTSEIGALSKLVVSAFTSEATPGWSDVALARLHLENCPETLAKSMMNAAFHEVCTIGDEVVGAIQCARPHLLSMIAVRDSARGQGVGRQLVEHFIDFADRQFPENEILQVNATTYSASFYKRLGFFPISETIDFDGCRFIRMAYWLRPRRLARGQGATSSQQFADTRDARLFNQL